MYSYNGYKVETDVQLSSDTITLDFVPNDDCSTTFTGLPQTSLVISSPSTPASVEADC